MYVETLTLHWDVLQFSHKSIIEIQNWCLMIKSGSQLVLDGLEVRAVGYQLYGPGFVQGSIVILNR